METVGGVDVLGQFYRLHVLVTDMEPRRLVFLESAEFANTRPVVLANGECTAMM